MEISKESVKIIITMLEKNLVNESIIILKDMLNSNEKPLALPEGQLLKLEPDPKKPDVYRPQPNPRRTGLTKRLKRFFLDNPQEFFTTTEIIKRLGINRQSPELRQLYALLYKLKKGDNPFLGYIKGNNHLEYEYCLKNSVDEKKNLTPLPAPWNKNKV